MNSPTFEIAADAVVNGDTATLEGLLRENPGLIRARSTRTYHATLLHYVAANGVEDFRQKTPANVVAITETLLKSGADVDAMADMYGGRCTTLGLVVTSIHPYRAGVLEPLVELLLHHRAALEDSVVNACLANGRAKGAELMAAHGALLDLEGAAGVGRLDVVQTFFNEDASLKANATQTQLNSGFTWACEYGRTNVVEYLVQQGVDIAARSRPHGQTGLHWAAHCAHADIVRYLLDQNAPLDIEDETWGATPLGWAMHGWGESAPGDYPSVVAMLVTAGAKVKPEWLNDEKVRADPEMLAALGLEEET